MKSTKQYLGDGVSAGLDSDGVGIVLTRDTNFRSTTDIIYLGPEAMQALIRYWDGIKQKLNDEAEST